MNAPLRIAHLCHSFGTGGLERVVASLVATLPREQFHHDIIALTRCEADMTQSLAGEGVRFFELNKQPGQDWPVWGRLYRLLRHTRPQVLHTLNIAALEGMVPAWLAGVPWRIHAEHGWDMADLGGTNGRYRRLRRLLSPLVHRFVAVSRDLEQYLHRQVGIPRERIVLLPNAVDGRRFIPPPQPRDGGGRVTIGTVARLAAVKNQMFLLECLAGMNRGDVRLLLVGDGPERAALESRAMALGIAPRVIFTGRVDDPLPWYHAMDLFVLPSLAEGTPLTVLEAMACALPILATPVGGVVDLVAPGVTGQLIPAGDGQQWQRRMAEYADQPLLRSTQGAAGRRHVLAHHHWQTLAQRYADLFCGAQGRPAGPVPCSRA
ncbi:MAG: glycosyltransferase [Magnetococcus sp. WYHC-3]